MADKTPEQAVAEAAATIASDPDKKKQLKEALAKKNQLQAQKDKLNKSVMESHEIIHQHQSGIQSAMKFLESHESEIVKVSSVIEGLLKDILN